MKFDAEEPDEMDKNHSKMDRSQGAARAISVSLTARRLPDTCFDSLFAVFHRSRIVLGGYPMVQGSY